MTAEEVAAEIETSGYRFSKKSSVRIWHDNDPVDGIVWSFIDDSVKPHLAIIQN
jgi:hypothetical protein